MLGKIAIFLLDLAAGELSGSESERIRIISGGGCGRRKSGILKFCNTVFRLIDGKNTPSIRVVKESKTVESEELGDCTRGGVS